jgi:hypothetical protein
MEVMSAFVHAVMATLLPWLLLPQMTSGVGVVDDMSSGGSSGRFVYLFPFCERWGGLCIPIVSQIETHGQRPSVTAAP